MAAPSARHLRDNRNEPRHQRHGDRRERMYTLWRRHRSAANGAHDDRDERGMVEVRRLRMDRPARVERLAVTEADLATGVDAHDEEKRRETDEEPLQARLGAEVALERLGRLARDRLPFGARCSRAARACL